MLNDDVASRSEDSTLSYHLQGFFPLFTPVRGVEHDDVKGVLGFGQFPYALRDVQVEHPPGTPGKVRLKASQIVSDGQDGLRVRVDECHEVGPPRERLNPERPAAGEAVHHPRTHQKIAKDVKERLPDLPLSRPETGRRDQCGALELSSGNPHRGYRPG